MQEWKDLSESLFILKLEIRGKKLVIKDTLALPMSIYIGRKNLVEYFIKEGANINALDVNPNCFICKEFLFNNNMHLFIMLL